MRSHVRASFTAAMVSVLVCAGTAGATDGAFTAPGDKTAVQPYEGPALDTYDMSVNTQWSWLTSNRCEYGATVQGTVTEVGRSFLPHGVGGRFIPDLVLQAKVHCPGDQQTPIHAALPIRSDRPLSRSELEQRVESAGTLKVDSAGQLCTYHPDVFVDYGRPQPERVIPQCSGRGGGPQR
jgi:hypothetical protein